MYNLCLYLELLTIVAICFEKRAILVVDNRVHKVEGMEDKRTAYNEVPE